MGLWGSRVLGLPQLSYFPLGDLQQVMHPLSRSLSICKMGIIMIGLPPPSHSDNSVTTTGSLSDPSVSGG